MGSFPNASARCWWQRQVRERVQRRLAPAAEARDPRNLWDPGTPAARVEVGGPGRLGEAIRVRVGGASVALRRVPGPAAAGVVVPAWAQGVLGEGRADVEAAEAGPCSAVLEGPLGSPRMRCGYLKRSKIALTLPATPGNTALRIG